MMDQPTNSPLPSKRHTMARRVCIALVAVLLAWGWFRGNLMWRVRSERQRLEALTQPIQPDQWAQWGDDAGVGSVRNVITGERDVQRLRMLTDAVEQAERAGAEQAPP